MQMQELIKTAKKSMSSRITERTVHQVIGSWYWCDRMENRINGRVWHRWLPMSADEVNAFIDIPISDDAS